MKTSSIPKPPSQATARNCFLLNQFATPGLGSLMAKRMVPGIGQLLLAIAGFLLVLGWFVLTLSEAYNLAYSNEPAKSYNGLAVAGGLVFMASWCWALVTSISVLRQARAEPVPTASPPRIINPPPEK